MSFFRTRLDGVETRLAIPVNVATDARYRGPGRLLDARAGERGGGGRVRLAAHRDVPERELVPDLRPPARLDRPAAPAAVGAAAPASRASSATRSVARASTAGCASPTRRRRTLHGLEVRAVERFGAGHGRARRARGGRATAATSRATPRTSTGATSTRRATTAASARIATASSRASRSSATRSSTASPPGSSPISSRRPSDGAAVRALVSRAVAEVKGGADALVLLPPPLARAAPRARPGRLRADEQEAPLHRQAAPRRRPHRRARRRLALHARRLRLLLAAQARRSASAGSPGARRSLKAAASRPHRCYLSSPCRLPSSSSSRSRSIRGIPRSRRRCRRSARSRSSSTRSSCSPTAPSRACCRRTAACARSARRTRRSAARASRPRSRASCPGLRGGAVVAHMCPIYAVLAAPLVRPLRIPLVLWFTHWRASRLLRAAERASTAVTSVDHRSFPLPSKKLRAIGHGIDLEEFPCSPPRDGAGHAPPRARPLLDGEGARRRRRRGAARGRRRRAARARPGALRRGAGASRRARAARAPSSGSTDA